MFTDPEKLTLLDSLRQRDLRLFAQLITPKHIASAAAACGREVGTSPLNLVNLTWLALACAWRRDKSFGEVLAGFSRLHEDLLLGETHAFSTHSLPTISDRLSTVSEEAFLLARRRVPLDFWNHLLGILGAELHRQYPTINHFRRFRLLALDGTCLALPYSPDLLEHFGAASNKSGRKVPRARMVSLIFPFVRMLHSYRLGKYTDGERALASELFTNIQENDLILMDKGFWSYGVFWDIQSVFHKVSCVHSDGLG